MPQSTLYQHDLGRPPREEVVFIYFASGVGSSDLEAG